MKLSETGFRAIYKRFVLLPINESNELAIQDFPEIDKATHIIAYGYIDTEAGLTLEILSGAILNDSNLRPLPQSTEINSKLRVGDEEEDTEFISLDPLHDEMMDHYGEHIKMLSVYDADPEVERTRQITDLDPLRYSVFPDDIQVYIFADTENPEAVWVRLTGFGPDYLTGRLLNQPNQSKGLNMGDEMKIQVVKSEDGVLGLGSGME